MMMSFRFICYIKYGQDKFNMVIQTDLVTYDQSFGQLYPKIAQILDIAANEKLSSLNHFIVLTDGQTGKSSMIEKSDQRITYSSVLTIHRKPEPLAIIANRLPDDPDVKFLEESASKLMAFHLMVSSNRVTLNLRISGLFLWQLIHTVMVSEYTTLFKDFTPEDCRQLFLWMTTFYCSTFIKLNRALEPRLQRRFDLLKVIHTVANGVVACDQSVSQMIATIETDPEIKDYIYYYRNYGFDINLGVNTGCNDTEDRYHRYLSSYITDSPQTLDWESDASDVAINKT